MSFKGSGVCISSSWVKNAISFFLKDTNFSLLSIFETHELMTIYNLKGLSVTFCKNQKITQATITCNNDVHIRWASIWVLDIFIYNALML